MRDAGDLNTCSVFTVAGWVALFYSKVWNSLEAVSCSIRAVLAFLFSQRYTGAAPGSLEVGAEGAEQMKRLHVQIQPVRSPRLDTDAVVSRLQALAEAEVSRGDDRGAYIHVDFRPANVEELWLAVRQQVRADPELAACSIVCCEGERGWDDYRLLHHFDPAEPPDDAG
jgi:hypothetical protein